MKYRSYRTKRNINRALVSVDKVTGAGKECMLATVPVAKGDSESLSYLS